MEKIIQLAGRIDSSNAHLVEKQIDDEIASFQGALVLDAENLDYISSAGLRIILRLKKQNDSTKIINCNLDIYNIFEMTGFTEMMTIEKAYQKISVDGCQVIGEGAYGIVYRIDNDTIVKVYKNSNSIDAIIKERERAKKAFVLGVPTAISYDIARVGNLYGSVFEMLDAKSYAELLRDGTPIEQLVDESVKILKQIHAIEDVNHDLPRKKDEAITWAKDCQKYLPKDVGAQLLKLMQGIEDRNTLIHGDFHIKNIMHLENESLLIDMETLAVGHPIFEFACSYSIYEGFECLDPKNPEKFLGVAQKQCRQFIDLTFKKYFDNLKPKAVETIKRKAQIICYTRLLRRQIKHFGLKDKTAQASIKFCQDYLTKNVPLVDDLNF